MSWKKSFGLTLIRVEILDAVDFKINTGDRMVGGDIIQGGDWHEQFKS